jgi:hypothetical protein
MVNGAFMVKTALMSNARTRKFRRAVLAHRQTSQAISSDEDGLDKPAPARLARTGEVFERNRRLFRVWQTAEPPLRANI